MKYLSCIGLSDIITKDKITNNKGAQDPNIKTIVDKTLINSDTPK